MVLAGQGSKGAENMANMHCQGTVKGAGEKELGRSYWYAFKRAWNTRYYSVDFGATWHRKLVEARKAGEAAGTINWVRPEDLHTDDPNIGRTFLKAARFRVAA